MRKDLVTERLGTKSLDNTVRAKNMVNKAKEMLQRLYEDGSSTVLEEIFSLLSDAKKLDTGIFTGEDLYLWEDLAFHFFSNGDMDKAAQCLRVQAALQPGNCDPFLNLGGFYHATGMIEEAIDAYLEGLAICPEDEYICHNLANLLAEIGETSKAEVFLNRAILANPTRGINYWTKGNFCLERGNYDAAITNYRYPLNLMAEDAESADMLYECRLHLVEAYFGKGLFSQGIEVLEMVDWPDGDYRQRAAKLLELGFARLDGTENPPPNSCTREQALADGMIIDITEQARSLGFKYPTAVTRAIWHEIIAPPHFKASTEGERIAIILLAMREAIARGATGSFLHFTLILPLIDGDEAEFRIIAICHPGDQGEPVITIMFQDEYRA